jgi:LPXTG-motif cell wall-anchored protein
LLSGEVCDEEATSLPSNTKSSSDSSIVVYIVLGTALLLCIVAGVVFYRKKKGSYNYNKTEIADTNEVVRTI